MCHRGGRFIGGVHRSGASGHRNDGFNIRRSIPARVRVRVRRDPTCGPHRRCSGSPPAAGLRRQRPTGNAVQNHYFDGGRASFDPGPLGAAQVGESPTNDDIRLPRGSPPGWRDSPQPPPRTSVVTTGAHPGGTVFRPPRKDHRGRDIRSIASSTGRNIAPWGLAPWWRSETPVGGW